MWEGGDSNGREAEECSFQQKDNIGGCLLMSSTIMIIKMPWFDVIFINSSLFSCSDAVPIN